MTVHADIDSGLLEILARGHLSSAALASDLQAYLDQNSIANIKELEIELADKQTLIKRVTEELASVKKSRDLAIAAHIKAVSFKYQTDEYLLSVAHSKNPIIRFLAGVAKWPAGISEYASTKYRILSEVLAELHRQDLKWGEARQQTNGTGPNYGYTNELADAYREVTDSEFANGTGTWAHIFLEEVYEAMAEDNPRKLKMELIQVAAVAIAWVVSLTLQRKKKK